MATIGSVTKRDDGRYEGELRTLTFRAEVAIVPVTDKGSPNQPGYRVLSQGIEIGAGRVRKGQSSGKDCVSLSIAAPELGAKTPCANLGRAAGQAVPNVYALIWGPQDGAHRLRILVPLAPVTARGLLALFRFRPPTHSPRRVSSSRSLAFHTDMLTRLVAFLSSPPC